MLLQSNMSLYLQVVDAYEFALVQRFNQAQPVGESYFFMDSLIMTSIAVQGRRIGKGMKLTDFQVIRFRYRLVHRLFTSKLRNKFQNIIWTKQNNPVTSKQSSDIMINHIGHLNYWLNKKNNLRSVTFDLRWVWLVSDFTKLTLISISI